MPKSAAILFARKFELKGVKEFRRYGFEFEGRAIVDASTAFDFIAALALQLGGKEAALLRQRIRCAGGDLGKEHSFVAPSNDMAGGGDVDLGPVTSALNRDRFKGIEQFGVKRSSI